jgi:hypothetical protein
MGEEGGLPLFDPRRAAALALAVILGCASPPGTPPVPPAAPAASPATPPPASAAPNARPKPLRLQHAYEHPEPLELLPVTPEMAQVTCQGVPLGRVFAWIDQRTRSEATEPTLKLKYVCPPSLVPLLEHRWREMSCEARLVAVKMLVAAKPPLAWHALTLLLEDNHLNVYRCAAGGMDVRREAMWGLIALSAEQAVPLERTLASAALCCESESNHEDHYRIIGNNKEPDALDHLRWLVTRNEAGRRGAVRGDETWALAAMIKLGGAPERRLFITTVSSLARSPGDTTDAAHIIGRQLTYIGDRGLARAMLPWLDRHDRYTSHGVALDSLAEHAVDQAMRMGIDTGPRHRKTVEDREPPEAIEATRRALEALPAE